MTLIRSLCYLVLFLKYVSTMPVKMSSFDAGVIK